MNFFRSGTYTWMWATNGVYVTRGRVHYEKPFRREFGNYLPTVEDFLTGLQQAMDDGAATWCFHNGSVRHRDDVPDQRPRRSFDMRPAEGRLLNQLGDVEREFLNRLE